VIHRHINIPLEPPDSTTAKNIRRFEDQLCVCLQVLEAICEGNRKGQLITECRTQNCLQIENWTRYFFEVILVCLETSLHAGWPRNWSLIPGRDVYFNGFGRGGGAPCWIAPHCFISFCHGLPPTHCLLRELYKGLQIFTKVRHVVVGPDRAQNQESPYWRGPAAIYQTTPEVINPEDGYCIVCRNVAGLRHFTQRIREGRNYNRKQYTFAPYWRDLWAHVQHAQEMRSVVKCLSESLPHPEVGVYILPMSVKWYF
jgi:hypothetical protein